jgi:hypothetical protein
MREDHRPIVVEKGMMKNILGSKRDEVRGDWRTLHNEENYDSYCSPDFIWVIILRMRWGNVTLMRCRSVHT